MDGCRTVAGKLAAKRREVQPVTVDINRIVQDGITFLMIMLAIYELHCMNIYIDATCLYMSAYLSYLSSDRKNTSHDKNVSARDFHQRPPPAVFFKSPGQC